MATKVKPLDRYAVFGQPISHSKSPQIHSLFAEQTRQPIEYTAQEVPIEDFKRSVAAFFINGGKGLNCTVPLKGLAYAYAEHKTPRAELSKAVNTLIPQPDGTLVGDNTDGIGLLTDLTVNLGLNLDHMEILILGAGGASRGIIGPLLEAQPQELVIANRNMDKALELAEQFQHYGPVSASSYEHLAGHRFDLIINATSASLSQELPPLPEQLLTPHAVCYDLAYGDQPTPFVRWGETQGAIKSIDGLGMLVEQAAEAFYLWRGVRPQTQPVIAALRNKT